jgi:hypothetical protein
VQRGGGHTKIQINQDEDNDDHEHDHDTDSQSMKKESCLKHIYPAIYDDEYWQMF